jgi:hypothetical protein
MQNAQSARECHSTNAIDLGHITQSAVLTGPVRISDSLYLRRFVIMLVNHRADDDVRARRIAVVHVSLPVAHRVGTWKKADQREKKTHSIVVSKYVECVHDVCARRDQL